MFGGEVATECDENGRQVEGGAGGDGQSAGIAGYVLNQGMQMAGAARAWASRSRTFVRV